MRLVEYEISLRTFVMVDSPGDGEAAIETLVDQLAAVETDIEWDNVEWRAIWAGPEVPTQTDYGYAIITDSNGKTKAIKEDN